MSRIYIVGSMSNDGVKELAGNLREKGHEVFDDWISPGQQTDEEWTRYEKEYRGRDMVDALDGDHAWNVFEFDKRHLDAADVVVMLMPAGKSAHLELGYAAGIDRYTHIILDDPAPERYDVMYRFADRIWRSVGEFLEGFNG